MVRSRPEGLSHLAFFRVMGGVQKRHRRCLRVRTALGVHRRRCSPHVRAKSSFTPSLLAPTSTLPPAVQSQSAPSAGSRHNASLPPRSKLSSHQSSRRPGRRTPARAARPSPAQTMKGKEAEGTTAAEFGDAMKCFRKAFEDLMHAWSKREGKPVWKGLWSMDHAKWHTAWQRGGHAGIEPSGWCELLPLPVPCPDFQQPIEHTFNRWKRLLHGHVYQHVAATGRPQPTTSELHALCQAALKEACRVESIAADVAHYRDFLEIVAHPEGEQFVLPDGRVRTGVAGGWAPGHHR